MDQFTDSETVELDVSIRSYRILQVGYKKEWIVVHRDKLRYLLESNAGIPLHIISIIGGGHSGKSILMNLLINYLKNNCEDIKDTIDGDVGFRYGHRRKDQPIFNLVSIYPEIFIRRSLEGQEYGIILMDTQGLFDGMHSCAISDQLKLCKTISSVILFNFKNGKISDSLLDDIMNYLDDGSKMSNHTDLVFLMRDEYKMKFITPTSVTPPLLESFVKDLSDSKNKFQKLSKQFNSLSIFSLPKPWRGVNYNKFSGNVEDLHDLFKERLNTLFAKITQPNLEYLLSASQWLHIFLNMTERQKLNWKKFSDEFVTLTAGKFYSDRTIKSENQPMVSDLPREQMEEICSVLLKGILKNEKKDVKNSWVYVNQKAMKERFNNCGRTEFDDMKIEAVRTMAKTKSLRTCIFETSCIYVIQKAMEERFKNCGISPSIPFNYSKYRNEFYRMKIEAARATTERNSLAAYALKQVLNMKFYHNLSELCRNCLLTRLKTTSNVENLHKEVEMVLNDFFPPDCWDHRDNKVDKYILKKTLRNDVAQKAADLLKADCEEKLKNDSSGGFFAFFKRNTFDLVKSKARCTMKQIDPEAVDELMRFVPVVINRHCIIIVEDGRRFSSFSRISI